MSEIHPNIFAILKIGSAMKELEELYGKKFLERSLHEARFRYDALKRELAQYEAQP